MLVTKHAAELCALLVNDLYGELPSRILIALLTKGRSSITQLALHTSLTQRQIRNGLGVLIQQNLIYHHTDPDSRTTTYEPNADACYSLVRSGKILEAIESQYGTSERDLVQTLLHLGHAKIHDLVQAFESRNPGANGHTNGSSNSSGLIQSTDHLAAVLARLIQAEIVETVRPDSFRNPTDVYHEIERDVTKTGPGEKANKNKDEIKRQIVERMRQFRDQKTILKRQLDVGRGPAKRRKLENGHRENGFHDEEDVPRLNKPNVVVRVNHEKCLVELRNQRLAEFATDVLGETTGEIYRALLHLVTAPVSRCRPDPLIDEDMPSQSLIVTTLDVYEILSDSVNPLMGIGKSDKIDVASAERIRAAPSASDDESDDSDSESTYRGPEVTMNGVGHESDLSDNEDQPGTSRPRSGSKTNGDRPSKVKFEDEEASNETRIERMRQHLLLLAESKYRFVRHCGTMSRGQWAVDFDLVMKRLRDSELDAFIEQSYGRHGLRLTRILREKGKLDEKILPSAAMMKKPDVQGKMLAMQMAGLVDVQEVPKDNSRVANRTLFFWFFDAERTEAQLLDSIYKTMLRCLQTLEVQRHKERNILSFVDRKDVQGKEEEVMTTEHYNKYNQHLEVQAKLLGQVMRLDDMVAVLRDF
ncbi:RNA polymerase III Rpc82, C-terminal [Stachybotrys elegans]|uniref:DNA-directed RNA polymerase III subunit RPC3 n=1 Tax=Stachybotrys elegans TaxID=80388 RepID=A0A8K0SS52_9HYPO|nr:RNA polymerase III Rpc82, C-terminal [Stachybotrys elegans]